MTCLNCHLHGKLTHLLKKGTKEEYVFITPRFQVFPDTCLSCVDPECPYNFNMDKLLKNKKLRKRVLDYVFDATFHDMLLEYGIIGMREVPTLRELEEEDDIYSKPTFTEKNGKLLLKLDEKTIQKRKIYFDSINNYSAILKKTERCPRRIIIKRKDILYEIEKGWCDHCKLTVNVDRRGKCPRCGVMVKK